MALDEKDRAEYIRQIMEKTPDVPYRINKLRLNDVMNATALNADLGEIQDTVILFSLERIRILEKLKTANGKTKQELFSDLAYIDGILKACYGVVLGFEKVRL